MIVYISQLSQKLRVWIHWIHWILWILWKHPPFHKITIQSIQIQSMSSSLFKKKLKREVNQILTFFNKDHPSHSNVNNQRVPISEDLQLTNV